MVKHSIVFLVLMGTCYAADLPICISANELASQYAYDRPAADAKYKGKTLVITGQVYDGTAAKLDLKTEGIWLVRCLGRNLPPVQKGQKVTVRAIGDGTVSPLTVSSCSVVPAATPCEEEKKHPASGPNVVQLTLAPVLKGNTLVISGTTNLRDGAILGYEIEHESFKKHLGKGEGFKDGDITVKAGRYSANVPVTGFLSGKISVWVGFLSFHPQQPKWVKAQYGEDGDKLQGPQVKLGAGHIKTVEIQKTVVKP